MPTFTSVPFAIAITLSTAIFAPRTVADANAPPNPIENFVPNCREIIGGALQQQKSIYFYHPGLISAIEKRAAFPDRVYPPFVQEPVVWELRSDLMVRESIARKADVALIDAKASGLCDR